MNITVTQLEVNKEVAKRLNRPHVTYQEHRDASNVMIKPYTLNLTHKEYCKLVFELEAMLREKLKNKKIKEAQSVCKHNFEYTEWEDYHKGETRYNGHRCTKCGKVEYRKGFI